MPNITMWWEQQLQKEPIWQTKLILQIQAFYNFNHYENQLITRLLPMDIIRIDYFCIISKVALLEEHFDGYLGEWLGIDCAHWMTSIQDTGVPFWWYKSDSIFQEEFIKELDQYCCVKTEDVIALQQSDPNEALKLTYIVVWRIFCRTEM